MHQNRPKFRRLLNTLETAIFLFWCRHRESKCFHITALPDGNFHHLQSVNNYEHLETNQGSEKLILISQSMDQTIKTHLQSGQDIKF